MSQRVSESANKPRRISPGMNSWAAIQNPLKWVGTTSKAGWDDILNLLQQVFHNRRRIHSTGLLLEATVSGAAHAAHDRF